MARSTALAAAALAALLAAPAAAAQPPDPPRIGAADRAAIVEGVAAALADTYVFADVAERMIAHARQRLAAGDYDGLDALPDFTARLTEDLRSVSHDLHLTVFWQPAGPGDPEAPSAEERQAAFARQARRDNYCFEKVEHLAGNVGYLQLDCFMDAALGGATAVAAMNFLAGSDALIVDLRANGGGSPSMIQLLTSYLFDEPKHLNSFYIRKGDRTEQYWTHAHVQGPRLAEVPVFVLTSAQTFSAAEEFTYNLRHLERATIVGETTGGGAHPVEGHPIAGHPVVVMVPFGRAVNPVTGTNWEGSGVAPHVEVPAAEALDVAHARALAALAEEVTDPGERARLAWIAELIEDRRRPATLTAAELASFTGAYGQRRVRLDGETLLYRRGDGPEHRLVPVGADRFLVGDLDTFRIRFERDEAGAVTRLVGLYDDGSVEPSERDGG